MTAAVASMVILYFLYLFDSFADKFTWEWLQKVVTGLSFYTRYTEFTQGVFNLTSVLFYVSAAFIFNFFSVRVLEKKRWS